MAGASRSIVVWCVALAAAPGCGRGGFEPVALPSQGSDLVDPVISGGGELTILDFEENGGSFVGDSLGRHPATIVGDGVGWTAGPPGCGRALAFAGDSGREGFAEIPSHSAWDMSVGSLDLWFLPGPAPADLEMLLTRDASGQTRDGHFTLGYSEAGRIFLRQQRVDAEQFICSEPVVPGQWVHVAVNFGPPVSELYIDGRRVTPDAEVIVDGSPCDGARPFGIDGNDNPWAIGASNWAAVEGTGRPVSNFLHGAAIDRLRIRSERATLAPR
jgi:hypothetical protein